MTLLARYCLDTGMVTGVWESSSQALLEPNIVPDDSTHGYVFAEGAQPSDIQERWCVVDDVLVEKTVLVITATSTPFAADGLEECSITVVPFVECTLELNGTPYALTTGDPAIELTSEVPAVFQCVLPLMAGYWATPLLVEAV
jgi:hypothetical protein